MKRAAPASYYDEVFATGAAWGKDHHTAGWSPLWRFAAQSVSPDDRVLDLGCGPGHLAALLVERGLLVGSYLGVDFSSVGLEQARARVEGGRFVSGRLAECVPALLEEHQPTVVIACEVLEHLEEEDERAIYELTRPYLFVLTLPMHDSASHVRHFPTAASVVERYLLDSPPNQLAPAHWGLVRPPCEL